MERGHIFCRSLRGGSARLILVFGEVDTVSVRSLSDKQSLQDSPFNDAKRSVRSWIRGEISARPSWRATVIALRWMGANPEAGRLGQQSR